MKRLAIQLVLFLLLGAIVNVAVALGGFTRVVTPNLPVSMTGFGVGNAEPDAEAIKLWQTHAVDGWPKSPLGGFLRQQACYDEQSWRHHGIGHIIYNPRSPLSEQRKMFNGIGQYAVKRVRCGLPMRALQWDSWNGQSNAPPGLFSPNVGNDGLTIGQTVIPQTPIWPGFAINTIFYAAVLWMLFAAPRTLKRIRRRRRGQCLHCGYDLRGQPRPREGESTKCPECGNMVIVKCMGLPPPATPAAETESTTT